MTVLPHRPVRRSAARRFAESAAAREGVTSTADFHRWWRGRTSRGGFRVTPVPFAGLRDWWFEPTTGNLVHRTGGFFTVEGLQTWSAEHPERRATRPVIVQPDIGILGVLVKEFDGVLHCLMQAKMEPGNVGTLQLSPTVQATRSNYTRVHRGGRTPHLEHFLDPPRDRVHADVLGSEQAEWFLRKRNRNLVVEADGDVETGDDFRWLTVGQLHELLHVDNLLNMDARTVLAALPYDPGVTGPRTGGGFAAALARGAAAGGPALHDLGAVLGLLTDAKVRHRVHGRLIGLQDVAGWRRTADAVEPAGPGHFRIIGAAVEADNREVRSWTQPLLAPLDTGLCALLAARLDGVLHVLVRADVSAGYLDTVELGPTVQVPTVHAAQPPRYLDAVLGAAPPAVRYDTVLSEEGGRFHHAQNRYAVVEVDAAAVGKPPEGFAWVTPGQLTELVRRGFTVNMPLRTLVAALHTLW